MKFLVAADLHLRATTPISRSDDMAKTCLRKLWQLVRYGSDNGLEIILTGDVFDRAENPTWFLNKVIACIEDANQLNVCITAIAGNHDLRYHSLDNIAESSLWILDKARVMDVGYGDFEKGGVSFYFYNFGEDIDGNHKPGNFNVLVTHTPVFADEVPFYMKGAYTAKELEEKYPMYDLILAGDIHQTCITDKVINPGSMLRLTSAQKGHRPCFVEVNTDTGEKTIHYFDIEEDVWWYEFTPTVDDEFVADLKGLSEVLAARGQKLSYPETVLELSQSEKQKERLLKIMDSYKD